MRTENQGFTLLEALISIGLAAIILAVYGAVLFSVTVLRRAQYNVQARNFIQEEMDSLRTLAFDDLLTRTDGNFLGVALQRGPWKVTDMTASGAGRALTLDAAQSALIEETGLAILPGNYRNDFTFTAKAYADSASPAGWGTGIAFRYRDAENHYRFRFSAGGIALDRVLQGVKTTLWSQSATYTANTWYTLEVVANAQDITIKKNGVTLATVEDFSFTKGDLALMALNSAKTSFNDVGVTVGAQTDTWSFESDALGIYPSAWRRMSYLDLPSGAASLTISDYLSQTSMKNVSVKINWTESGSTRSATGSTVIGE